MADLAAVGFLCLCFWLSVCSRHVSSSSPQACESCQHQLAVPARRVVLLSGCCGRCDEWHMGESQLSVRLETQGGMADLNAGTEAPVQTRPWGALCGKVLCTQFQCGKTH
ncbi:hypothetical protein XELAEV_18031387mg [Xenopus laevis]|uniref:Uncharacterized protein n=1 Tax=Xenopus laevis TaxID=8355 RepID=A0A974CMZ1_XENLA|nr:hypothetical protein XELAEV_18031387mg [Xenopus laevis]